MLGGKKLGGLLLCLLLIFTLCAPSFAADRPVDKQDLAGISPKRHKYLFAVAGGAAIGAGVGVLLSGGNDITKGALLGGGGASTAWLHSHPREGGSIRPFMMLVSHTALGTGIGWTICGCDDGLVAGALVGGGTSALWQAMQADKGRRTRTATAGAGTRP